MNGNKKGRPAPITGRPSRNTHSLHSQDRPDAHSLPTCQGTVAAGNCPTCGAGTSALVWRDLKGIVDIFAHAIPSRMAPWCSKCDRPWHRNSADTRLWKGALA